jgi:hypothetical protein
VNISAGWVGLDGYQCWLGWVGWNIGDKILTKSDDVRWELTFTEAKHERWKLTFICSRLSGAASILWCTGKNHSYSVVADWGARGLQSSSTTFYFPFLSYT